MLFIDLEVYSEVSIKNVPLDVYANHPSTEITLACMAADDEPVYAYERAEVLPVLRAVSTNSYQLCAWNVGFERTVLAAKGFPTPLSRWTDAMVLARYIGLPGMLKKAIDIPLLAAPPEAKTRSEALLRKKFCTPLTGKMKKGTPEEWEAFVDYCRRDVESTRHVYNFLQKFGEPQGERRMWELDQLINARGLPMDRPTIQHACTEVKRLTLEAKAKMQKITGLDNPNSVQQLLPWLQERGYQYDSLAKELVQAALNS